jgi:hypothetical protein
MRPCRKCQKEVHGLHHGLCDDCDRANVWLVDPPTCTHANFSTFVGVNRISRVEGGPVLDYVADIEVRCADCGTEFAFLGISRGISIERPTVSIDATCLSMPMMPGARAIPSHVTIPVEMPGPVKLLS